MEFIFKWGGGGGAPWGYISFDGGIFEKNRKMGVLPSTMGNLASCFLLASAFFHCKSISFTISRNINIDCVLMRNL